MTPSICGSFLVDKRSLVAFTWTITTVMTLVAFVLAVAMMIQVHTHYKHMERYYEQQWYDYQQNYNSANNQNNQGGEGQQQQQGSHDSEASNEYKNEIQTYLQLSQISSNSMTFVAVYTMSLAVALCIYGSTAIVGFTSLRGVYIAPCFSSEEGSAKLRLGIFGGAVVFFANVLLVAAVVLGEVRIEDFSNNNNQDGGNNNNGDGSGGEMEQYEVERIATILAVTCMFLSALYIIFAVLLFLYFGNGGDEEATMNDEAAVQTKIVSTNTSLAQSMKMMHHHHQGVVVGTVGVGPVSVGVGNDGLGGPNDPRRESFIVGRYALDNNE